MVTVVPDYYKNFRCIADRCRHSCCIGWEIDIDDDTLEMYKTTEGDLGRRLCENIVTEADGTSHFRLGEDERCPFLNSRNLCDIYTQLGPDGFCQICDDHPRFRNFYSDRTEIGLGLCCEAAAKLILSQKETSKLVCIENDGGEFLFEDECDLLDLRDDIFDILQNRSILVKNRIKDMLNLCGVKLVHKTAAQWADIFMSLEKLDDIRDIMLEELKSADESRLKLPQNEETETAFEQLAVYFVYRHLADSLDDDRLAERIKFVVLSCKMIYLLCAVHYIKNGHISVDDMAEIARVYSSEVEYSDDNMEKLFEVLS